MARVPCPRCGRTVDRLIEGLCEECHLAERPLVELRAGKVLRCKYCGSYFARGRWAPRRDLRSLAAEWIYRRGAVEALEVEAEEAGDMLVVHVRAVGRSHPEASPREATYSYSVPVQVDICPDCRTSASRAERGLVQVRARPRGMPEHVRRAVMRVVELELYRLREKRVGTVLEVVERDYGIDISTSTPQLARRLAYAVGSRFPSHVLETARSVGARGERRVYHMTYSVSLLLLERGNVIRLGGEMYLVADVDRRAVSLVGLGDGRHVEVPAPRLARADFSYLGDARPVPVLDKDGKKFVNIDNKYFEINNKYISHVYTFIYDDKVYVIPL